MIREIAFLGQDGIGKSTISEAIADRLRQDGHQVLVTSWTRALRVPQPDFAKSCLGDMLLCAYRGMYAAARSADTEAQALFPKDFDAFMSSDATDRLLELDLTENSTWGLVAGAFSEMAGNFFFRNQVVEPGLAEGAIVIQETFGYKHLVKDLFLAKELAKRNGETRYLPVIEMMEGLNELMFSTVLAPEVGILMDGDPEVAVARRLAQSGGPEWTEDLQLACDRRPESFLIMQQYSNEKFREFAKRHGWPTIMLEDESEEKTVQKMLDFVLPIFAQEACAEPAGARAAV